MYIKSEFYVHYVINYNNNIILLHTYYYIYIIHICLPDRCK